METNRKHLEACIQIEQYAAEIYYALIKVFPEGRKTFGKLAEAEERHANILYTLCGIEKGMAPRPCGRLPLNLKTAHESLDRLAGIVHAPAISLTGDIIPELMKLESSLSEGYMDEIRRGAADNDMVEYLRQFQEDETSHLRMIMDLRAELFSAP